MINEPIEAASFRYSSSIIPSPYLRRLGFLPTDTGRFPFVGQKGYSLHDSFTIKNRHIDPEWATIVGVFAPEQAVYAYGSSAYPHLPVTIASLDDVNLYGLSLKFSRRPGIRTLRELESSVNKEGLLGEVVVAHTQDDEVAFVSPDLLDNLYGSDFPSFSRREILTSYGLRNNGIKVLSMSYKT